MTTPNMSIKPVALSNGRHTYLSDCSTIQVDDEQPEFDATISDELKERCFLFF